MGASIKTVNTTPYTDQKPGTSGLRKRVKVFKQPHYTENFVQAIFDVTAPANISAAPGSTSLVVGGDGRYYMKDAIQIIIRIGVANGITRFIIGKDGILSTPAGSNLIRRFNISRGGILLTASHNPGGPDKDFGIKYNAGNGGPAPESVTDKIYARSKELTEYKYADIPEVDLSKVGTHKVTEDAVVEIVDSVETYVELLKSIFDFDLIRNFLKTNSVDTGKFKVLFDGLNGVTGPYGKRLFVDEFGLDSNSVDQAVPLPDFGGGHPDPNLTYADKLVARVNKEDIDFGAASDGDGDRNMVLSKDWFVTPSDSVAVIADYADYIPYFKTGGGLKGLARSMPTSTAIDRVANAKGLECFEVPTGWKFFGNLMDAGRLSICGEESFGTGSDHIREKDGLWAVVAWLNVIAAANDEKVKKELNLKSSNASGIVSVKDIMARHFSLYGRNYFTRYDYEEVESEPANAMVKLLRDSIGPNSPLVGKSFNGFTIKSVDDFEYTDPIDGSVTKNQGIRIIFADSSRIIFRLSGTGSQGATIRIYIEKYEPDAEKSQLETQDALKDLVNAALTISKITEFTGRSEPTVIT
ncbi:hypothetical protein H4219_006213 [Mycoemilia scoparia]|uniref:phosphoglucomutase (alpha-D-glucose-1,6-bisphosphate-dependent) n=1 Tax=Mycoemilia scoparia TaxID=417184 RepID=A0A9W7ZTW9_9FUNG|nr:hypothetical protein H4219_006213 [Mycoemilia scoparia]